MVSTLSGARACPLAYGEAAGVVVVTASAAGQWVIVRADGESLCPGRSLLGKRLATELGRPRLIALVVAAFLLFEDAVFGELRPLVVGETQQLGLDPVVVLAQ